MARIGAKVGESEGCVEVVINRSATGSGLLEDLGVSVWQFPNEGY